VVRALLTLVSSHPDLVAEREPGGRLARALERDRRLRDIIERSRQADGNYGLTDEVLASFERVFRKTVQGLFYGLYERLVEPTELELLRIENSRFVSAQTVADELRPPQLLDITDLPLSEISPHSWHSREPVIVLKLRSLSGGPPIDRLLRLKRETPVDWMQFQPGVFSFTFVKREGAEAACVLELWDTLIVAVAAPWPDSRGPIRRGRNNPMSRDTGST